MEILDGVLTYILLNSAKLSREQKQSVKIEHNIIKDQLKKVFTKNTGDLPLNNYLSEEKIKFEYSNDVQYAQGYSKLSYRGRDCRNSNKINRLTNEYTESKKTMKRNKTLTKLEGKFQDVITVDPCFIWYITANN